MLSMLTVMAMAVQSPEAAEPVPDAPVNACSPADPTTETGDGEIVICVERPDDGYRIDPDILEAERQARRKKLKRPERYADNSCESVGIMGCRGGTGVNLLAAAIVAATIAKRAAEGGNVGEMFVTDPQPDEYKLYLENKRKREAEEAAAKAKTGEVAAE